MEEELRRHLCGGTDRSGDLPASSILTLSTLPDLLLPFYFDKRLAEKVLPALRALGVEITAEVGELIRRPSRLAVWPVRIRRPREGSILLPVRRGRNCHAGEAVVSFPSNEALESLHSLVRIDRVYGMSAQASPTQAGAVEKAAWEDHPMLAVSTDFITILADILPGKDVFVGVDVWANSMLPLSLLAQRPPAGMMDGAQTWTFRWLAEGHVKLGAACTGCSGSGEVECRKCEGHGTWQPEGECRKCGGTGDFIGKYGDRMGDCNRCDGTGEPPILPCNTCEGSGSESCRTCSGEGVVHVGFNASTGCYFWRGEEIPAEKVAAWDGVSGADYALSQKAGRLLQVLLRQVDEESAKRAAAAAVQKEISGIDECLERAMGADGATRDLLDFRPVLLGAPEATTARQRKRLVLKFPILNPPAWARHGTAPFAVSTCLRLAHAERGSEVEIRSQSQDAFGRLVEPIFAGLDGSAKQPCFLISFPADIVIADLPERLWVSPNLIPPPELAQQRELARWCIPDEAPALISAFTKASPNGRAGAPAIIPLDQGLGQNPRQQEALNLMMSDAPLVLIKGPPGTGKTTVISEAVRQAVSRRQKVLICSETHQAVANVLERLHRDGSIRMIRHARPDNPSLTDLERDYLEGGAKQGFLTRVRERTAGQVQACHRFREKLALLPGLLEMAHDAAALLKTRRDEMTLLTQEAEATFTRAREAADRQRTEQIATLESNRDSEIAHIEAEAAACRRALLKAQEDWRGAAKRCDDAAGAYLKKTGASPERGPAEPAGWFDLSFLIPNMLATPALLQERFARAAEEEQVARRQTAQYECSIAEHERSLQECRRQASSAIQEVQSASERVLEAAQQTLDGCLQDLKTQEELAESEHLPSQEKAAQAWNSAAAFPPIARDNPPCVWRDRISDLHHAMELNEEKAEFCERWQKAAETSSKELTGLFWNTTQVFLSTCVGLASWRTFHEHCGRQGVEMVIIDEAAHATLAQTLIPLSRARRAILIGDEMQLPPAPPIELGRQCESSCSARCPEAACTPSSKQPFKADMSPCWLERSAFEWLAETRPSIPRVTLNRQFRMHPDIADFIGEIFYQDAGGLENGVTARDRHLAFGEFTKAICLVSTSAYENRYEEKPDPEARSYQNQLEVDLTRRILKRAGGTLGEAATFGIVTPYAAQKVLMEKELGEFFAPGSHVILGRDDIASVDSFQGSERDVMIASFVRSPKRQPLKCRTCAGTGTVGETVCDPCKGRGWTGTRLDWVHDLRRLNVAFSRARRMLILVGDIKSLTDPRYGTKEGAEVLRRFFEHVTDRGRVLHVWEGGPR